MRKHVKLVTGYPGQDAKILYSLVSKNNLLDRYLFITRRKIKNIRSVLVCDLLDKKSLKEIFQKFYIKDIIHFADISDPRLHQVDISNSHSSLAMLDNILGCINPLETQHFIQCLSILALDGLIKADTANKYGSNKLKLFLKLSRFSKKEKLNYCSIILGGHESILRSDSFVFGKINQFFEKLRYSSKLELLELWSFDVSKSISCAVNVVKLINSFSIRRLNGVHGIANRKVLSIRELIYKISEYHGFSVMEEKKIIYVCKNGLLRGKITQSTYSHNINPISDLERIEFLMDGQSLPVFGEVEYHDMRTNVKDILSRAL